MKFREKLQAARTVLLEHHQLGKPVELAVAAIKSRVGADVMHLGSAKNWYRQFDKGDYSMENVKSPVDDRPSKQKPKFLDLKRALYCEMKLDCLGDFIPLHSSNGRFQFFRELLSTPVSNYVSIVSYRNWVLDTFHGQKRPLLFNFSTLLANYPNYERTGHRQPCFNSICFVSENLLLAIGIIPWLKGSRSGLIMGELDLSKCTLNITDFAERENVHEFVLNTSENQSIGVVGESIINEGGFEYRSIDVSSGRMVLGKPVDLSQRLYGVTRRGDHLFGFTKMPCNSVDFSLLEISLVDGKVTKHKIPRDNRLDHPVTGVWLDDKFIALVSVYDCATTSIYTFELSTMKWKDEKIEVVGTSGNLTLGGKNVLVVNTEEVSSPDVQYFYRFVFGDPEPLVDLSWLTVRRRAQFEPKFYKKIVRLLPRNSRLRCPWLMNARINVIKR